MCCGADHSLALSDQHVVYGWCDNDYGQCGMRNDPGNTDARKMWNVEVFLWGGNAHNECCVEDKITVWAAQSVNEIVLKQS